MEEDIPTYHIGVDQVADASEELVGVTISKDGKVLDTRIIEAKTKDEFKRQLSGFITEVTFGGKIGVS